MHFLGLELQPTALQRHVLEGVFDLLAACVLDHLRLDWAGRT